MNEIQQSILESLSLVADASVRKANSTITIEAKINQVLDYGTGLYEVEYMGNKLKAYANSQSVQYSVDDKVYVLVPDGDFTKEKIIIGATAPTSSIYSASKDNEIQYLEKSGNLLVDVENLALCSYKTEIDKKVSFSLGNFNAILKNYLSRYNTLIFSCKVKTDLPPEQRIRGNYGLKLRLFFNQINIDGTTIVQPKDYIIDINNMIGNPYNFSVWTTQRFYIEIDDVLTYNTNYQPELYAFVKDFEQSMDEKPNDIFISNISLAAIDTISQVEEKGYSLVISAEEGELFLENQYKASKKLTPILRINGLDTNLDNSECYWFVEDSAIDETSEYYLSHGGRGWKCLNERTNITRNIDGSLTFQYITNNYEYTVAKTEVKTALRYKCVIIYKNNVVSKIIKIENLDSDITTELFTSTGNNVFIKNVGEVHLISRIYYNNITNITSPIATLIYNWVRYDKNNNYIDNDFYETVAKNRIVTIDNKTYYETEIKFPVSLIEDLNVINCTIKTAQTINGQLIETLVNTDSISLTTTSSSNYLLTIQNGNALYKYDADGDSPLVANYDGPESSIVKNIKPLTYQILKKDGTELTESEYIFCDTEWIISKQSMIRISSLLITDEDDFYYYVKGKGKIDLYYTIAPQFNSAQSNNTILLNVNFDNNILTNTTTLQFLKDGASGTNGTKYTAIITHNGYGYREVDENNLSRKLQLVYIKNIGWKRYDIESNTLVNFDYPEFNIDVYKNGALIPNFEQRLVTWSIFDENATNPCFHFIDNGLAISADWEDSNEVFCTIVQAKVSISEGQSAINANEYIYAYYPIEITYLQSEDLATAIIPSLEGGFSSVLYASDGTNPRYDTAFDFRCVDNLYNQNTENLYTYLWSTSDNLIATSDKNNCKVIPKEKYDNGDSKNFIKVALGLTEQKQEEAAIAALNHQLEIEKYNNLKTYYTNHLTYLKLFVSQFSNYSTWINLLDNSKTMLAKRANTIDLTNKILEKLTEFYDFCDARIDRFKDIIDFNTIYITNRNRVTLAKDRLFLLGDTTAQNLNTLINLSGYSIIISETDKALLKQSLGIGTYTVFTILVDDYNKLISQYITYYDELKLLDAEADNFTNLKNGIKILCSNSYLEKLRTAHDEQSADIEFVLLHNDLISMLNSFSDQSLNYYSYDSIKTNIMTPLKERLLLYTDADLDTATSSALSAYYVGLYDSLIKTANDNKIKEEKEYEHYINMKTIDVNSIVHIRPIIMMYNRYELSAINGWDGNKLYTGTNNDGDFLFAPQIGAGRKEEDNSFTGIVMGLRKRYIEESSKTDVGLFGYNKGIESIFLNAEDGSASFGVAGAGQIIISPGNGTDSSATIYGGNYIEGESGLIIDLTKPEIKFGSGNFEVNELGYLTAKGGGSIAGWKIGDTILSSIDDELVLDAENIKIYSNYHKELISLESGFYLGPDGLSIGNSFRIQNNIIKFGKLSTTRHWTISSSGEHSYISYNTEGIALNDESVYLGTNGISLGKYFKVETKGIVRVGFLDGKHWRMSANNTTKEAYIFYGSSGTIPKLNIEDDSVYIGTNGISLGKCFKVDTSGRIYAGDLLSTKHWTIASKGENADAYIAYNTTNFNTDADSVYIGTNGISLGNNNSFWVTSRGELRATKGYIGGWAIGSASLQAGNLILNANGSIYGPGWLINETGKAEFNNMNITGGTMTWTKTDEEGNIVLDAEGNPVINFQVNDRGAIVANEGYIGAWKIDTVSLLGDETYISTNGHFRFQTINGSYITNMSSNFEKLETWSKHGINIVAGLSAEEGGKTKLAGIDGHIYIGTNRKIILDADEEIVFKCKVQDLIEGEKEITITLADIAQHLGLYIPPVSETETENVEETVTETTTE